MGVADGVGGWSDSGVDPSLFSQALMYHAHRCSKTAWAGEPEIDPTVEDDAKIEGGELVPLDCLEIAYGGVLNERGVNAGTFSKKTIFGILQNSLSLGPWYTIRLKHRVHRPFELVFGPLKGREVRHSSVSHACVLCVLTAIRSLGDSGFVIIRSSAVIHSQPSQTHFFNCPR
jgi:protein phosphatase PTC7